MEQLENVERFKYLGSMLTNDGRCTREIKSRIAMAKAAFSKKKTLFTSKLDLNLRKRLIECYIWSMALYGAETWTLRAADQKYLESYGMCSSKISFLHLMLDASGSRSEILEKFRNVVLEKDGEDQLDRSREK